MGLFILPRTNAAAHRHPQRTCLAALALACLLTANAGTLAGCASSHPITKSGEQCASCHSDGRAAVEGTGSASATETGLTFAVESGAGEVYPAPPPWPRTAPSSPPATARYPPTSSAPSR